MTASTKETQAGTALGRDGSQGLDATMQSQARTSAHRGKLGRGAVVGRYVVLSKLGSGAMGVVYAAYDPELDRKVALKLLLPGSEGSTTDASTSQPARTRLVREAQALAKLAHPNIVAIHDVGTVGDRVFLAMEFVAGQTLGDWLEAERRPWTKIVEVMSAAGRGLAAAHDAGLLHRDFKPDNVMVGDDGRVRVMDFGLARARPKAEVGENGNEVGSVDNETQPELSALAVKITQAGALMGTPAYMAPELFSGKAATARSDQFAFCVTLWAALYGERPFGGVTLVELMAAVLNGRVRPVPTQADNVPRWLEQVCRRGIATEAEQRYESIDALLADFVQAQRTARRRRILRGVAALVVLGAVGIGGWRYDLARRVAACDEAGRAITRESWNDSKRQALRDGLLATEAASAPTVVEKTLPWLDRQAASWAEARTGACMDTTVDHIWSDDLLDRATWCLDERRLEFEALVVELSDADDKTIHNATAAAARLRSVEPCRDAERLARLPAPPAERAQATKVKTALARAGALSAAGKFDEGLGVAQPAFERARVLAWPPLVADAGYHVGTLLDGAGRYEEAESALTDAYFEAVESGTPDTAADAATALISTVGYKRAKHDEGKMWGRHAAAALVVLREPDEGLRFAPYSSNLATIHYATGAYDDAKALNERAIAIDEAALGPNHPDVAHSLSNLANVHKALGEYDEAQAFYTRALSIYEAALGPSHPSVGHSLNNLGSLHDTTGEYDQAKALLERALSIYEAAFGPEHPDVADALNNLANVHYATGEYDDAQVLLERALSIHEAALGPDHPDVALSLDNLANVHYATGDYEGAKTLYKRALAIDEVALGPDHPNIALSLDNLANVHYATGELDEARALYNRAISIFEAALGPDHPIAAYPLTGLAGIELAQGRPALAIPLAERATQLRGDAAVPSEELADSRFELARALWDAAPDEGRDRQRARRLAEKAREGYAEVGGAEDDRTKVERWLTKHE